MTDFPVAEFEARAEAAQRLMAQARLDALWLTTEAEVRYFTGFRTLFWQSPTRPWHVILPAKGKPIAIIPGIGAELMAATRVDDIRSWPSPRGQDEGVSLLTEALSGMDRIGVPMGAEASLRQPLNDFNAVTAAISAELVDCTPLIQTLRFVKSEAELAIIRKVCAIGSSAFARAPDLFRVGQPLSDAFRAFKIALLEEGAEDVPYLVGGVGPEGYGDVISPPSDAPLAEGDVLMLDTGATLQGYFCDFDRNFALGRAFEPAKLAYAALHRATDAGLEAARPGTTCAELFHAMAAHLGGDSNVGRLGHGLGMQLTEWPSIAPFDQTVLKAGMVMTLEPSIAVTGTTMMVQEENILITDGAPELLTTRAAPELPVI